MRQLMPIYKPSEGFGHGFEGPEGWHICYYDHCTTPRTELRTILPDVRVRLCLVSAGEIDATFVISLTATLGFSTTNTLLLAAYVLALVLLVLNINDCFKSSLDSCWHSLLS